MSGARGGQRSRARAGLRRRVHGERAQLVALVLRLDARVRRGDERQVLRVGRLQRGEVVGVRGLLLPLLGLLHVQVYIDNFQSLNFTENHSISPIVFGAHQILLTPFHTLLIRESNICNYWSFKVIFMLKILFYGFFYLFLNFKARAHRHDLPLQSIVEIEYPMSLMIWHLLRIHFHLKGIEVFIELCTSLVNS